MVLRVHGLDNPFAGVLDRKHLGAQETLMKFAFHNDAQTLDKRCDFGRFGSVIQYVPDIVGLLRLVAETTPDYILAQIRQRLPHILNSAQGASQQRSGFVLVYF